MKVTIHDTFVDVCCKAHDMSEGEIETVMRTHLLDNEGIYVTENSPGRVGNPGEGIILRFQLDTEECDN